MENPLRYMVYRVSCRFYDVAYTNPVHELLLIFTQKKPLFLMNIDSLLIIIRDHLS